MPDPTPTLTDKEYKQVDLLLRDHVLADDEQVVYDLIARMVADAEQRGRAEALREFARKWADWTARDAPQIRGGAAYRAVCEAQALDRADEVTL